MIALPGATAAPPDGFNYRVLMNQYNEDLKFSLVDKGIPNRGIDLSVQPAVDTDQFLVALDYQQTIEQIDAADFPSSGKAGGKSLPIHHEPGLWLHMLNQRTSNLDVARLATIPHGDSVLALGKSDVVTGRPQIPALNGLPIGVSQDPDSNPYLAPYKFFIDSPFNGALMNPPPGFPGFQPLDLNAILNFANDVTTGVDSADTTVLHVDTDIEDASVVNIPFIVKQANATSMKSTFWIQELAGEKGEPPVLRMQYSQTVMLDFFPRRDGVEGLIRWPHVSICTLIKQ